MRDIFMILVVVFASFFLGCTMNAKFIAAGLFLAAFVLSGVLYILLIKTLTSSSEKLYRDALNGIKKYCESKKVRNNENTKCCRT